jgi:Acetyltransferase (GNAT) domain
LKQFDRGAAYETESNCQRSGVPGIGSSGHVGRVLVRDGELAGWGVIRPCRKGRKIGPLVADNRATAEAVLSALLASVGVGEIFPRRSRHQS